MKARCINHDVKYTGTIDDIETYKSLRDGKLDFNPNIKSKISHIMIPYDLFIRLMEMDKEKECKSNDWSKS